jgi:hypothetical protein
MKSGETRDEAIIRLRTSNVSRKETVRLTGIRKDRGYATINEFDETGDIPGLQLTELPQSDTGRHSANRGCNGDKRELIERRMSGESERSRWDCAEVELSPK